MRSGLDISDLMGVRSSPEAASDMERLGPICQDNTQASGRYGDQEEQKQNWLIYVNAADRAYGREVRALRRAGTAFWFRVLFTWLPRTFTVHYWCRFFSTEMGDYVFGRHARLSSIARKNGYRGLCIAPAL